MELETTNKERLDELEIELRNHKQVDCPVIPRFTDGLYTREIFMPANTLIVSKIHKSRHQFVVSKGVVEVKVNDEEWERIEAPYVGITEKWTRRVLFIVEDCVWMTMHPNPDNEQDLDILEDRLILTNDNPLLYPLKKDSITNINLIP